MNAPARSWCARRARRIGAGAACLAVLALGMPGAASAAFSDLTGHLSVGYSHLFIADAPAGSMSALAGADYPFGDSWGVGGAVGFHLLGGQTVERGSLLASVDYSLFEADAMVHWYPRVWGPIYRLSAGPAVLSTRADLSSSGGGAAFGDLAVEEVVPGAALDVTMLWGRPRPVRVGLELSLRQAFLEGDDWTVASARLAFHY